MGQVPVPRLEAATAAAEGTERLPGTQFSDPVLSRRIMRSHCK